MRSFIISFSGNDGTGKSTLVKALYHFLKEKGKKVECRAFFEHFLLEPIFNLFSSQKATGYRSNFNSLTERRSILHRLWPFIICLESSLTVAYFKIFKRNKIIIFDRYFYDYLVSYEILGLKSRVLDFLSRLIPHPDVVFILDVDFDTARERKRNDPSFEDKRFNLLRKRYLTRANNLGIKPIDTSFPEELVLKEAISLIEKKIRI